MNKLKWRNTWQSIAAVRANKSIRPHIVNKRVCRDKRRAETSALPWYGIHEHYAHRHRKLAAAAMYIIYLPTHEVSR